MSCSPAVVPPVSMMTTTCAACHGAAGQGNEVLGAPSIAGLPEWYVLAQLNAFRAGHRGVHPADAHGLTMAAIAKALSPDQMQRVSVEVAMLPRVPVPPAVIAGNANAGRELYEERCMECHRFNGEGELVFGSAPLVGLSDRYLFAQLQKFANGQRGVDAHDANGQKMRSVVSYLEGEQAMRDVIAYVMTLNKPR